MRQCQYHNVQLIETYLELERFTKFSTYLHPLLPSVLLFSKDFWLTLNLSQLGPLSAQSRWKGILWIKLSRCLDRQKAEQQFKLSILGLFHCNIKLIKLYHERFRLDAARTRVFTAVYGSNGLDALPGGRATNKPTPTSMPHQIASTDSAVTKFWPNSNLVSFNGWPSVNKSFHQETGRQPHCHNKRKGHSKYCNKKKSSGWWTT